MRRYAIALGIAFLLSSSAWAAEAGAALYKAKCAGCHGPTGEGKMGPALKGTKLTEEQLTTVLTKGAAGKKAPHSKPMTLTEEQAKAVASYVKSLK